MAIIRSAKKHRDPWSPLGEEKDDGENTLTVFRDLSTLASVLLLTLKLISRGQKSVRNNKAWTGFLFTQPYPRGTFTRTVEIHSL